MNRRNVLLGLGAVPFALAACSKGPISDGRTKIVFGEQRTMYPVADASKVLEGTPYDFKWATFATPSVMFEAFRAGELDLASSNDVTILNAATNGVKLKIIGATDGGLLHNLGIVVRKDVPVHKVADLKGRKIIVSSARGGSGDTVLRAALREAGLKQSDVEISYAPFNDSLSAFRSDALDVLVTNDPYLILAQQHGGRLIRDGHGLTAGLAFIVAADSSLADPAKRAAIGDVVRRLKRGLDWCRDNPDAYARFYAKEFGLSVDLVLRMNERSPTRIVPISDGIVARTRKVADNLVANGVWERPRPIDSFFDTTVFTPEPPK